MCLTVCLLALRQQNKPRQPVVLLVLLRVDYLWNEITIL